MIRQMTKRNLISAIILPLLASTGAYAQEADDVPVPFGLVRGMPAGDTQITRDANVARESVELTATITNGGEPIEDGLTWHVFERNGTQAGDLVAARTGGAQTLRLPVGEYVVHVAYGRASAVSPFTLRVAGAKLDPIVLNAGGITLAAEAGGEPIGSDDVRFSIYEVDGERRRLIQPNVSVDETVQLVRGVYRVVAQYGDINAVGAADVRVRVGEVTEATLGVPGAPVVLKLVREGSTNPIAATSWRVFDGEGKQLFESEDPAPELVLAAGTYTAEAVNGGSPVTESFTVNPGQVNEVAITQP